VKRIGCAVAVLVLVSAAAAAQTGATASRQPAAATPGETGAPAPRQIQLATKTAAPRFDEAVAAAKDLPRLHSLLVSRRGELLLERYYNGASAARVANVKSVAKSIISALVGMAIDRRLIAGVETPIVSYFPELKKDRDQRKMKITVEDLLTMRPGLESTSNRNYGAWVQSRNWVQHALSRPMLADPGQEMDYSTGNTHLLSAIVTKVTGTSTWQFANDSLARPLGFALTRWPRDPQGIYFGGNDMLLTPRQMLAFGELYLRKGRVDGKSIVPERWIDTSMVPRGRSNFSGQRYGYGWWVRELAGHDAYYAWGFGGQYIIVVPDLEMVVVATSSPTVAEDRRSHRVTLFDLIEQQIIARADP
jgi:CubicO group peptidase (beta-lactamase class C family)